MQTIDSMILRRASFALLGLAALVSCAAASAGPANNSNFDMIVMADPQPFRVLDKKKNLDSKGAGTEISNKSDTSARLNHRQGLTIKRLSDKYNVKGVIINGDLVETPSITQRRSYNKRYRQSKWKNKTPIFSGLGDHDFGSNWDYADGKAREKSEKEKKQVMYFVKHYHIEQIKKLKKKTEYCVDFDYDEKNKKASLAYSWEIDEIHFVQLNNYPTMTDSLNDLELTSSLGWLEKNLQKARDKGKSVILNFHDCCNKFKRSDRREFEKVIDKFDNITAVFVGHLHYLIGRKTNGVRTYGKNRVPIFQSGSPIYGRNLLLRFRDGKMEIHKVRYYNVNDNDIYGRVKQKKGYTINRLETIDLR